LNHVVRGHPGGLLQSSRAESVKIFLASASSGIHAVCPNRERRLVMSLIDACGLLIV